MEERPRLRAEDGIRRRRPSRCSHRALIGAVVVIALAAVGATARIATAAPGPALFHATGDGVVHLAGTDQISWPDLGWAAAEVDGFGVVGRSGSDAPTPLASVTKVMATLVVLDDHPLDAGRSGLSLTITPSDVALTDEEAGVDDSVLPVVAGEVLSERQALEALLVPSADNIAAFLAVADAGSVPAFVARMNAEAARLGLRHTTYADPSGLDPASVSTPTDQIRLADAAMRIPAFADIVDQRSVTFPVVGPLANWNSLVGTDGFTGVKTGSTRAAGGNLLFTVRREIDGASERITAAVLGQEGPSLITAALTAASSLADSVFADLARRTVVGRNVVVAATLSGDRTVTAETRAPLRVVAPAGAVVRTRFRSLRPLLTGRAGQVVGYLSVVGAGAASSHPVAVVTAVAPRPPTIRWRVDHSLPG